jgi:hypothetical protein
MGHLIAWVSAPGGLTMASVPPLNGGPKPSAELPASTTPQSAGADACAGPFEYFMVFSVVVFDFSVPSPQRG